MPVRGKGPIYVIGTKMPQTKHSCFAEKNNFLAKPCGLAHYRLHSTYCNCTGVIKHDRADLGASRTPRTKVRMWVQRRYARSGADTCLPSALSTVLGTSLTTVSNTCIQSTTDDVVTNTRKVLYTTARTITTECSCRLWPSPGCKRKLPSGWSALHELPYEEQSSASSGSWS